MITGAVNANREAIVPWVVVGPRARRKTLEAVVDTGFSGDLTLPIALTASLGLNGLVASRASSQTAAQTSLMCMPPSYSGMDSRDRSRSRPRIPNPCWA